MSRKLKSPNLIPFDPEIEKTARRLRKKTDTGVVDASLLALVNKDVSIDLGSIDVHGGLFMGMTTKVVACLLTNLGGV